MDSQPKSSGLVLGRQPLCAILHSSNEPGDLSQWLCHDDSTINIVVVIIIIIIIILHSLHCDPDIVLVYQSTTAAGGRLLSYIVTITSCSAHWAHSITVPGIHIAQLTYIKATRCMQYAHTTHNKSVYVMAATTTLPLQ